MLNSDATYDVIIIGSGVGGLTSGLTLQTLKPQLKTLILEQHNAPGGYISGFRRKGYYFDSGAEGLIFCGEGQRFKEAIDGLGVGQEFLSIDPIEVLYYKDKKVTMYPDPDKYQDELIKNFPEDTEGIRNFFSILESLRDEYNRVVKQDPTPSFKELVKIALTCPKMRRYALKTFKDFLDEFITNDLLKKVLSVYCLWFGETSDRISAAVAGLIFFSPIYDGHYYPKGGMLSFAKSLANTFVKKGGEIQYKKIVARILTKRRKAVGVVLSDGTIIRGKWIISNADLKRTIFEYVGINKFPKSYLNKITQKKQSVSGFTVFLGLDKELKDYPSHMAYNLDPDKYISDTLEGKYNPREVLIRIPPKIDPELSNNNKSSVILLSFAPYYWENKWNSEGRNERKKAYRETKEKYADKLIKLAENLIPELSQHVLVKAIATPLTFERYSLSSEGSWYGPRSQGRNIRFRTPVRKLVLTGANIEGGGVLTSFFSGMKVAKHINRRLKPYQKALRIFFPILSFYSNKFRTRIRLNIPKIS